MQLHLEWRTNPSPTGRIHTMLLVDALDRVVGVTRLHDVRSYHPDRAATSAHWTYARMQPMRDVAQWDWEPPCSVEPSDYGALRYVSAGPMEGAAR